MKKIISLCAVCAMISGCASTPEIATDAPLNEIYARAYEHFNAEKYDAAADTFQMAETQYPASAWAGDALIMTAYSRYLDGDFPGAITAADRFMRFHPGDRDVPYVLYLRGMSYYRQVSDVRREPGMSAYALQQFQQLTTRFPNSDYAKNAQNKIRILKNYIAGKIMFEARTEMQNENWTSAITHLQAVITDAQDTVMTAEALFRLTECYTALGLPEQAAGYSEMLRKNFPDNEWTNRLK